MDPHPSTLHALDWELVLSALSRHARTLRGAAAALRPDFAATPEEVLARYAAVAEVWSVEVDGTVIPAGGITDVADLGQRASRGEVLEAHELLAVANSAGGILAVKGWIDARIDGLPTLAALLSPVEITPEFGARLERSFDAKGQLADEAWPALADARRKMEQTRARILRTLDELLRSESFSALLQDRFVTERDGRYVLPLKASHRKGVGIVHGRSQSGETFYVEPAEVVELTNDLREAEAEVARETRRILSLLSAEVGQAAPQLSAALEAVTQLDLAIARAGLGASIDGVLPRLGDEGVLHLEHARHPVLAIRRVPVTANDLRLDSRTPGLVLTGPNTGGKTVALKTLGLAALFARAGLPLSAGEGSRVDFFERVVADVGDAQTISQDLSTFSGHLTVIRGVLEQAGPGALVLLDEVTAGTDPAQGAALARAILEAVVDAGARIAVTTHFAELKSLPAADPRFSVGAMRIRDGRPTYRLESGVAGDSHALAAAARLGLPAAVLDRAHALMEPNASALSKLLDTLGQEREALSRRSEEIAEGERALAEAQRQHQRRVDALETREREVRRRLTSEYQERLRQREREIKGLIAALQENPNLKLAGGTLTALREAREEVELPEIEPPPVEAPPSVAVGDKVTLRALGQRGVVRKVDGDRLEVECGAMRVRVKRDEIELPAPPRGGRSAPKAAPKAAPKVGARVAGKVAPVGAPPPPPPPPVEEAVSPTVRLPFNTLDLRGKRVDEALEAVDLFLGGLSSKGTHTGWILHGHGTGALKQAVRDWLPSSLIVRRWRPADTDEGGDAFTLVEIR